MLDRRFLFLLLLGWLSVPVSAHGQVAEEDEAEKVEAASRAGADGRKPDLSQVAQSIIRRTNEFRREHGREPVEPNKNLMQAAQYFANYMARTNKYGHTADGNRPAERAKKYGYDYCIVLENIAYQYSSAGFTTEELARKFFQGWKNSPGHRKNMLNPYVTETGVAVARSEDTGYYYAVQMFGRPKSKAIEFKITNQTGATVRYEIGKRTFPLPPRYTRTHMRCRPTELTFRFPDRGPGKGKTMTMKPKDETHLVIVKEEGEFQVKKK